MSRAFASLLVASCLGQGLASAQELLVCESNFESVLLVSGVDGHVIDPVFQSLHASTGTPPQTPIQALPVGQEIWITDRDAGVVFRFDRGGLYLGELAVANWAPYGIARYAGRVWISSSSASGGKKIATFAPNGIQTGDYDVSSHSDPAGLMPVGGALLVADVDGDDLDRYKGPGAYAGTWHDSDGVSGIDAPQQIVWASGTQTLLAAGYDAPSGIYEYTPDGVQVGFFDTAALGYPGVRGVYRLTNGNILFTTATGIHVYDTATDTVTTEFGGVLAWSISLLPPSQLGTVYCDETQNPNNSADTAIDTVDSGASTISVTLTNAPSNQFTVLLVGDGMATVHHPPGSKGDLCILGGTCIGRYNHDVQSTGSLGMGHVDIKHFLSDPCAGGVVLAPGSTWNFQWWHRQPMGQPATFSAALSVTFE